ncbi:unnamed protein product [Caenorhabditis auriculariae]|uniref:Transmembrane protein n=1 Tax=Caenorhabditis auriculariae TaxID=2777116 RepID=A0A8S1HDV2_9PELO|nr:unnamed protein product [Caenorhabditis auriculariae]
MEATTKSLLNVFLWLVAVTAVVSEMNVDGWDPTVRDKTEFCERLVQYAPNSDVYCESFVFCCNSQFDPMNGDKCQVKAVECEPVENSRTGRGSCLLSNCTELLTTTTTTTTSRPLVTINAAPELVALSTLVGLSIAVSSFLCSNL